MLCHSFDSGGRGGSIASAIAVVWLASASLRAESPLRIVSPESGAVVNAGGALTVTIKAAPSVFQSIGIAGDGPFALNITLTAPPYQYPYRIPADFAPGLYRFKAAGVTASGETVNSEPIEVDIERPDEARKLQSEWQSVTFGDQTDVPLLIWGMFADGSKIDVTRSKWTTYISDRPAVAAVSKDGGVSAIGVGKAKITVRYGDKTIVVPVVITQKPVRESVVGSNKPGH